MACFTTLSAAPSGDSIASLSVCLKKLFTVLLIIAVFANPVLELVDCRGSSICKILICLRAREEHVKRSR